MLMQDSGLWESKLEKRKLLETDLKEKWDLDVVRVFGTRTEVCASKWGRGEETNWVGISLWGETESWIINGKLRTV